MTLRFARAYTLELGQMLPLQTAGENQKTEFYWQLATHLFADHEEYGVPFLDALNTASKKARDPLVLKVKNQLNRFVSN